MKGWFDSNSAPNFYLLRSGVMANSLDAPRTPEILGSIPNFVTNFVTLELEVDMKWLVTCVINFTGQFKMSSPDLHTFEFNELPTMTIIRNAVNEYCEGYSCKYQIIGWSTVTDDLSSISFNNTLYINTEKH